MTVSHEERKPLLSHETFRHQQCFPSTASSMHSPCCMEAILQTVEGVVMKPSTQHRLAAGFNAVGIHLGAATNQSRRGDYLGWEVQAKALKGKGLAVSRKIQYAIDKTKGK